MPDRFWVGGTASWDGTAGTKWSTTSGGPGGASVPTSADDVFFTNLSTGTCTIASGNVGARSINCTGFTGTLAGSAVISVAGSITLSAGMTFTYTGTLTITGSGTITSAGKTFPGSPSGNAVTINGIGITVGLGDAFSISSGNFTLTQGTFNTNNFAVSWDRFISTGSSTRAINLGSSTVTMTGVSASSVINIPSATGLAFNAGTSQINITAQVGLSATINVDNTSGVTFHNVAFTNTSTTTRSIVGNNTFNNLSFTGISTAGTNVGVVNIDGRQTINGTLSTIGTAGNQRVWLRSATYGIAHTLTVNGTPSITDMDFRDIIVVGTAAPISGTRIGDLRGNRGITFSAPKTVYRTGTGNWFFNQWSATSGGPASLDNFPLAQDTAVFDNSTSAGTHSMSSEVPYCGTVDMSARTTALTLSIGAGQAVYGNWISGSGITYGGSATLTFSGRNTQTVISAGKTSTSDIVVDSFGGTVILGDALNHGIRGLTVTNGTFDTGGFNVTAGSLVSSNANVRALRLGSSTVILSGTTPINFSTSTNLTLDAGTSTIDCTATSGLAFNGGNQTFNNVLLSSTTTGPFAQNINGSNTFNNLTISAQAGDSLKNIAFAANQVITGTLSVTGSTAVRRVFFNGSTIGTPITLTVASLSTPDCDFRDITIAGAAAGSSPTRAGDCGGNSGITFPAPKTVYWNLAGSQSWSATGWATSSGGTPAINNFPLAQDTAVIDNAGAAGTITMNVSWNIGTFNASSRTTAMTFSTSTFPIFIHGNWLFGTGVTTSSTSGDIRFVNRATSTITSNGVTFNFPIEIRPPTGATVQLADALASTRQLSFVLGGFDAVTFNVTINNFSSFSTSNRTLSMGSGTWTLTGTGTVWDLPFGMTNYNQGTANIVLSDNTTTARTFAGGGLAYNKLTIGGNTSTSTTTITNNNQFAELASTKTVAHTIALGSTIQTFGKWTVTGTVGNVVTLTGTGLDHILAGACTSGIDYLAMGSIGFTSSSGGEFYAGANSTGTAGAPVYRTTKPADSIRYWVGGTGNWSDTARWSLTSGGPGGASVPRSHDDVVFNSGSNATAYTATVNTVTGGARCKTLTIAGPASGNVTLAGTAPLLIHDNITLPTTGLTRTYTGVIVLTGSSTGRTITSNGITPTNNIEVNGIGCEWLLNGALTLGNFLTLTNGTFDLANFNYTASGILSDGTRPRTLKLGSGTVQLSTGAGLNLGTTATGSASLTFNAGTSQINLSASNASINGNGKTFHNVSLTSNIRSSSTIAGTTGGAGTTFNNLIITGLSDSGGAGISTVLIDLPGTIAVNGTFTVSAGASAAHRTFIRSSSIGSTITINCATFSGTDVDFRDVIITGAASPISGTRLGDCKGNSGITFSAGTIKYWNLAGGGNWGDSVARWATSSGGTPAANNFPLPQDTCVFGATGLNSGATVTINASYNVGTVDMSARTGNTMTLSVGLNRAATIYGDWINGTGVTLSAGGAASIMTFAGRVTQNITSAGVSFPIRFIISSPGGSVVMQDSLTYSSLSAFTLTTGTFDAAGFNFTHTSPGTFTATGSTARQIAFGSGTWTFTTAGGAFNAANTQLTVTGNGTITLTSGSTKSFAGGDVDYSGITLNQGGAGTLTITGNNTFRDITATQTATSAATISLGTTTQRLTRFTGKGEAGRLLTLTSGSTSLPCTLIYTGADTATDGTVNHLSILGVRAYPLVDTWYAGANSVNDGTLGWQFVQTVVPVRGQFLMFVMPLSPFTI